MTHRVSRLLLYFFAAIFALTSCFTPAKSTPSDIENTTKDSSNTVTSPLTILTSSIPKIEPTSVLLLPTSEREDYVFALIDKCQLPCFMDIIPGETSWEHALNLFVPIGKSLSYTSELSKSKDYIFGTYIDENTINPYMLMRIFNKDGVVVKIFVQTEDNKSIHAAVQSYSLEKILEIYNAPSAILLGLPPGQSEANSPVYYSLWITYNNLNFAINYEGIAKLQGDKVLVCLNYENITNLRILIQSPIAGMINNQDIEATTGIAMSKYVSLETATDNTVNSFYTAMRSNSSYCIESPINVWQ